MGGILKSAATVAGGALGTMVAPGIGTMIGSGLGNIAGNVATGEGNGIGGLLMGGATAGLTSGIGSAAGGAKEAWGAAKQAGDIAANQVKNSFGKEMVKGLGLDTATGRVGFGLNAIGNLAQGPNVPTDGGPIEIPAPMGKLQQQPLLQSIRSRGPYIS